MRVTASLGYETSNGQDVAHVYSLRAHAERAMRVAKQRGGDCRVHYRSLSDPLLRSGDHASSRD